MHRRPLQTYKWYDLRYAHTQLAAVSFLLFICGSVSTILPITRAYNNISSNAGKCNLGEKFSGDCGPLPTVFAILHGGLKQWFSSDLVH